MKKHFFLLPALLLFIFLISLFLGFGIYDDQTILVGDSLYYNDPSFRSFAGNFFSTRPSNFVMDVDNNLQNYPFFQYTQRSFRNGEIPWWNPYVGMGIPFVGFCTGVFDPVSALAGIFAPTEKLTNVIAVLGLLIAACGMLLFLGALGMSRPARIFGAIAFTFSGWTIVHLGRQMFMADIWMPWIFWAAERLVQRRSASRIALLALCCGLVCLPGHLQTSLQILAAVSFYFLVRIFQENRASRSRLGGIILSFTLALTLGIGIALIQIIPTTDLLRQPDLPQVGRSIQLKAENPITAIRYSIRGDWEVMRHMVPTALTAVSPLFFGTPRHSDYWWPTGPFSHFAGAVIYVGLLPLFFALYGFTKMKSLSSIRVWLVLAVVSAGVAYALPVFNLVNYLPGFDQINNGRVRLVYRFAVIVAAAIGFERFTDRSVHGPEKGGLLFAAGYAAAVCVLPVATFMVLPATALGKAVFADIGADQLLKIVKSAQIPVLVVLTSFVLLLMVWKLRLIGNMFFRTAVILIAFADSFWFFHDFNPLIPSSFVFPETHVVKFLKKDPSLSRVSSASMGYIMPANIKQLYGIYDIDLFSVLTVGRYAAVQSLVNPPSSDAIRNFHLSKPASYRGLINLMNVKYIVVPALKNTLYGKENPFGRLDQYRLVYDREVLIYENLEALPRAFLMNRATVLDTPADVLNSLKQPGFDPRKAVLLEKNPVSPALPESADQTPGGGAEILSLTSNRVIVRANTQSPAYLVLSEVNYPGWKATVDGVETTIYTAYYLFRSVYLKPGTHEIVFTFMPKSYALAWKISLGCLAITFVLLIAGFKRRTDSQ